MSVPEINGNAIQKSLYLVGLSREFGVRERVSSSWQKTVRRDCIRPLTPLSLEDTRCVW
jgi:hypothetical protein